jgi:hypothetical protein
MIEFVKARIAGLERMCAEQEDAIRRMEASLVSARADLYGMMGGLKELRELSDSINSTDVGNES